MTQIEREEKAIARMEEKLAAARARKAKAEEKAKNERPENERKMRRALHQLQIRCWKTGLTRFAQEIVSEWGEVPPPLAESVEAGKSSKTKKSKSTKKS